MVWVVFRHTLHQGSCVRCVVIVKMGGPDVMLWCCDQRPISFGPNSAFPQKNLQLLLFSAKQTKFFISYLLLLQHKINQLQKITLSLTPMCTKH